MTKTNGDSEKAVTSAYLREKEFSRVLRDVFDLPLYDSEITYLVQEFDQWNIGEIGVKKVVGFVQLMREVTPPTFTS